MLWRDRNRYDLHDSPDDVEHGRYDHADEEQYKGVIKNSLKYRDANESLRASAVFTHCYVPLADEAVFSHPIDSLALNPGQIIECDSRCKLNLLQVAVTLGKIPSRLRPRADHIGCKSR